MEQKSDFGSGRRHAGMRGPFKRAEPNLSRRIFDVVADIGAGIGKANYEQWAIGAIICFLHIVQYVSGGATCKRHTSECAERDPAPQESAIVNDRHLSRFRDGL